MTGPVVVPPAAAPVVTSSSRRAVLCADGRIHYGPDSDEVRWMSGWWCVEKADAWPSDCRPHYLAEQITTVTDWQPVPTTPQENPNG